MALLLIYGLLYVYGAVSDKMWFMFREDVAAPAGRAAVLLAATAAATAAGQLSF
jgi:hypothetical protein